MDQGGAARPGRAQQPSCLTAFVVNSCVAAASGGLLLGYTIGIAGRIPAMVDLKTSSKSFCPDAFGEDVFDRNNYCTNRDDRISRLITASLYLAGVPGACAAACLTKFEGRRPTMMIGAMSLACGILITLLSQNVEMLILGRICLGASLGFGYQTVPLYLSEMAPSEYRGAFSMMFQLAISVGTLCATLTTYAAAEIHPLGWRFAMGLAMLPAMFFSVGALFLPETPISLIWHGKFDEGKVTLQKIRGTMHVDEEFQDLMDASRGTRDSIDRWPSAIRLLVVARHRPHLVMAILLPIFQVATGIEAVLLYIPHVLRIAGFGQDVAMYTAVIVELISAASILISMTLVDRGGRKLLFFGGGVQMFVSQALVGVLLKYYMGLHNILSLPVACAVLALLTTCLAAFGWSWGSVAWTVINEMFPLEVRSAGQTLAISINFLCTFCIIQVLTKMMCTFEHLTYLYFAGWILIMTSIVWCLLPETGGVPLEGMSKLWKRHWFWERYYSG